MNYSRILSSFLLLLSILPLFAQPGSGEGKLRPPAVPLVVHDPFFSTWLMADEIHSEWPRHWTLEPQGMTGSLRIDGGEPFRFLGAGPDIEPMEQTRMEMTATRSIFTLEKNGVELELEFCSPLLAEDLEMVGRPVSYITFSARSLDGKTHDVQLYFDATGEWAVHHVDSSLVWERKRAASMPGEAASDIMVIGSAHQKILQVKGDRRRIEWGQLYMLPAMVGEKADPAGVQTHLGLASDTRHRFRAGKDFPPADNYGLPRAANADWPLAAVAFDLGAVGREPVKRRVLLGYDDLWSVEYFGKWLRPWWNRTGTVRFETVMAEALEEADQVIRHCRSFDGEMYREALETGGQTYADLCVLAYRQSIAAHKLVAGTDGTPLFISKENASNGSMGTVDVTHPSIPLYLHYNSELVRGLLEFIFEYCEKYGWDKPWAPHDIGKYPIGNGQAYGRDMEYEESGNMILMTYALVLKEGNAAYAQKHWETLSAWAAYLKEKGWDPDNQLSTDDFGGRIDHNCNLSIKATLSLASYAKMAGMLGKTDLEKEYRETAMEWKNIFEKKALDEDHYKLRFDQPGTWSQKYNLVWDRVLGLDLYSPKVAKREVKYYLKVQNRYGLPLDCRNLYTKSDWIVWSACLAESREDFEALIRPLWDFYNETPDRYPMTDWYFTDRPERRGFQARSVVGGVFMKHLLKD